MINRNGLALFRAVAEAGGFSRAAEIVHVSQPAISMQVADLEGALDAPLFDRLPRGVRLTGAGLDARVFYEDELIVIARADHLFAARAPGKRRSRPITGRQFCAQPLVVREPGRGTREVVDLALERVGSAAGAGSR